MDNNNWISVEEKMPVDNERIIFYTKGYINNEMRMGSFHDIDQFGRPNMFIGDGFFHEQNVSHWQPLPAPPTK